jgi:hypothetical protein
LFDFVFISGRNQQQHPRKIEMKLNSDSDISKSLPINASAIAPADTNSILTMTNDNNSNNNNNNNLSNSDTHKTEFEKIIQSIFHPQNIQNFISHLNPEQLNILNQQTGINLTTVDGMKTSKISICEEPIEKLTDSQNQTNDNNSFNALARIKIEYNSSNRHQETTK